MGDVEDLKTRAIRALGEEGYKRLVTDAGNQREEALVKRLRFEMKGIAKEVGPTASLVWQALRILGRFRKVAYPKLSTIELYTGLSERTISRQVKKLEQKGWLSIKRGYINRGGQFVSDGAGIRQIRRGRPRNFYSIHAKGEGSWEQREPKQPRGARYTTNLVPFSEGE